MKKKFVLLSILILCVSCLICLVTTTHLSGGENLYGRFDRDYKLQEGEILYGTLYFHKEGIAPIWIEKVSLIKKKDIPCEVKIFFGNRQHLQMTGGSIREADFEEGYGENLISSDQFKWLRDKDFQIVVTTKEDKLEGVWVEIEYRILGIFPKQIRAQELII